MSKSNIIDLKPWLKNVRPKKDQHKKMTSDGVASVINMEVKREELLVKERRQTKRTILTEFVGAFIVLPSKGPHIGGLQKVLLYDISDTGISFDIDPQLGKLAMGEEIVMRLYLSQKNYFSFVAKVTNLRYEQDEEIYRHGCSFVKDSLNKDALFHFVKFIESVTLNLRIDTGDLLTHTSKK